MLYGTIAPRKENDRMLTLGHYRTYKAGFVGSVAPNPRGMRVFRRVGAALADAPSSSDGLAARGPAGGPERVRGFESSAPNSRENNGRYSSG